MTTITVSVKIGTIRSQTGLTDGVTYRSLRSRFGSSLLVQTDRALQQDGASCLPRVWRNRLRIAGQREAPQDLEARAWLRVEWHTDRQAYWFVCLPCHLAAWAVGRRTNIQWPTPGWQYAGAAARRARGGRVRLASGYFYVTEPLPEYLRPRAQASAPLAAPGPGSSAAPPDLRRRPVAAAPFGGAPAPAPAAPTSGQALAAPAGAAPAPAAPAAPTRVASSASSTTPTHQTEQQPPLRNCLKGARGILLETGPSIGRLFVGRTLCFPQGK